MAFGRLISCLPIGFNRILIISPGSYLFDLRLVVVTLIHLSLNFSILAILCKNIPRIIRMIAEAKKI